ncbi:MAG: hypothetical protein AAB373_06200 [Patescibacteria group bacterium]
MKSADQLKLNQPIPFEEALETYSDLVVSEPELLAAIKFDPGFSVPNKLAFRLFAHYKNLPLGQRLIFDKLLLNKTLKERVIQDALLDAHNLSKLKLDDLLITLEHYFLALPLKVKTVVLAIRMNDPTENSLRLISNSVRKIAPVLPRGLLTSEKKAALTKINEIQETITSHEGPSASLVRIYEADLSSKKPPDPLDQTDSSKWTVVKIRNYLRDNSSVNEMTLLSIFIYVFDSYDNEPLRASIDENNILAQLIDRIDSTAKISGIGEIIDQFPNPELKRKCLTKIENLLTNPKTALDLVAIGCADEIIQIAFTKLRSQPAAVAKVLKEMGAFDLGYLFHHLGDPFIAAIAPQFCNFTYLTTGTPNYDLVAGLIARLPHQSEILVNQALVAIPQQAPNLGRTNRDRVVTVLALAGKAQGELMNFVSPANQAINKVEAETAAKAASLASTTSDKAATAITAPKRPTPIPGRTISAKDKDPDESDPKKRPGEIDPAAFLSSTFQLFEGLKLTPGAESLVGPHSQIRGDLNDLAGAIIDGVELAPGEVRTVNLEKDSVLRRLNAVAVAVRRTDDGELEAQVVLKNGNEVDPGEFYPALTIENDGHVETRQFAHEPAFRAVLETEVLRAVGRAFGEEIDGARNQDILDLLGLSPVAAATRDANPSEKAPTSEPTKGTTTVDTPPPPKPEPPQQPRPEVSPASTEFLRGNVQTFDAFMNYLRSQTMKLPKDFDAYSEALLEMAREITVDKALDPGYSTVVIDKKHVMAPFIHSIDFYDPKSSRERISKLGLDPAVLHVDNLNNLDAYLVRVNITMGNKDEQMHCCILPPQNEIYFFGVDPEATINEEEIRGLVLNDAILNSFKAAVDREPGKISYTIRQHRGSNRIGAQAINDIIKGPTHGSFPAIVVCWPIPESPAGPDKDTSGEKSAPLSRAAGLKKLFHVIKEESGEDGPINVLMRKGVYVLGSDLRKHFYDYAEVKDLEHLDIYVPITNPEILKGLLNLSAKVRVASSPDGKFDPKTYLQGRVAAVRATEPFDEEKALAAFADSAMKPKESHLELERAFASRFRRASDPEGKNANNAYVNTLRKILTECRNPKMDLGEVKVEEVIDAILDMKAFDSSKLFIATSGGGNFRLSFDPRENGEGMPTDKALFETAHTVAAKTSEEIIKVMAGNRIRIARSNPTWLRGSNRTPKLNYAAKIQSRFKRQGDSEVKLEPMARALLVYEFEGEDGTDKYAFRYLDGARDLPLESGETIAGHERLMRMTTIQDISKLAIEENESGLHTDFSDLTKYPLSVLRDLQKVGLFRFEFDTAGVPRVVPGTLKPIKRKAIAIATKEQVGYKQFRTAPTNLREYLEYLEKENLLDMELLGDDSFADFNSRKAKIQAVVYETLGI